MRLTFLSAIAFSALVLSGCESEAEDAIVVDLLAIEIDSSVHGRCAECMSC